MVIVPSNWSNTSLAILFGLWGPWNLSWDFHEHANRIHDINIPFFNALGKWIYSHLLCPRFGYSCASQSPVQLIWEQVGDTKPLTVDLWLRKIFKLLSVKNLKMYISFSLRKIHNIYIYILLVMYTYVHTYAIQYMLY